MSVQLSDWCGGGPTGTRPPHRGCLWGGCPCHALSTGPVDNALPNARSTSHLGGMANIDGCPECVNNTESPHSCVPVEGAWRCGYVCSSCGHAWTTDWRD